MVARLRKPYFANVKARRPSHCIVAMRIAYGAA
jgi:hypothetical protein